MSGRQALFPESHGSGQSDCWLTSMLQYGNVSEAYYYSPHLRVGFFFFVAHPPPLLPSPSSSFSSRRPLLPHHHHRTMTHVHIRDNTHITSLSYTHTWSYKHATIHTASRRGCGAPGHRWPAAPLHRRSTQSLQNGLRPTHLTPLISNHSSHTRGAETTTAPLDGGKPGIAYGLRSAKPVGRREKRKKDVGWCTKVCSTIPPQAPYKIIAQEVPTKQQIFLAKSKVSNRTDEMGPKLSFLKADEKGLVISRVCGQTPKWLVPSKFILQKTSLYVCKYAHKRSHDIYLYESECLGSSTPLLRDTRTPPVAIPATPGTSLREARRAGAARQQGGHPRPPLGCAQESAPPRLCRMRIFIFATNRRDLIWLCHNGNRLIRPDRWGMIKNDSTKYSVVLVFVLNKSSSTDLWI